MRTALHQQSIATLAKDAEGAGALEYPDARMVVDNPVCGDRITIDIRMEGDTVESLAHNVRGCVLCQAAASLIGAKAPGCSRSEIDTVRDAVAAMLDGTAEPPPGKWRDLAIFAPVAAHRHRHHCVLLPFEALHRALDAAHTKK
jgi:nitrogen fixation NifU-like protein